MNNKIAVIGGDLRFVKLVEMFANDSIYIWFRKSKAIRK